MKKLLSIALPILLVGSLASYGQVKSSRKVNANGFPGFGEVPSSAKVKSKALKFAVKPGSKAPRPSSFLLPTGLPPIQSQGQQGSCTAWAVAYACMTYDIAIKANLSPAQLADPKWQMSPSYIFNQLCGPGGSGISIPSAIDLIKEQGCATLTVMPYNEGDFGTKPKTEVRDFADRYRIIPSSIVNIKADDIESYKQYLVLNKRPIAFGIRLYLDSWPKGEVGQDYSYNPTTYTGRAGNHAMAIIGYDDSKHAFRVMNSWGTWWGDKGYIWIDENYVKKFTHDAWGFAVGGIKTPGK